MKHLPFLYLGLSILILTACGNQALKKEHQKYSQLRDARELEQKADQASNQGNYKEAIPLLEKALAITEKELGPEHQSVAHILTILGGYYIDSQTEVDKAERYIMRSLLIREKIFGMEHIEVARSLDTLAYLYQNIGYPSGAEHCCKRSLFIKEKRLGPDHPEVADSLSSIAALYFNLGEYKKAEPLFKRSLAIMEKNYGPYNTGTTSRLSALARTYLSEGDYANAEQYFKRALSLLDRADISSREVRKSLVVCLIGLADTYSGMNDYAKAEQYYKRALTIVEKAPVEKTSHPYGVAADKILNDLGMLYFKKGEFDKSEAMLKQSLDLKSKRYGVDSAQDAGPTINLASLYAAKGNYRLSHEFMLKGQLLEEKSIDVMLMDPSEYHAMKPVAEHTRLVNLILSLAIQYGHDSMEIRKDALNVWLQRKGLVLEFQSMLLQNIAYANNPEINNLFTTLEKVRNKITELKMSGSDNQRPRGYVKELTSMEALKELLQRKIARISRSLVETRKDNQADCERLARAMPQNTILLDFAKVNYSDFTPGKRPNEHYLVFILRAGNSRDIQMIDLGEAKKIDGAIFDWRRSVAESSGSAAGDFSSASTKLFKMVFDPIEKKISNIRQVFISPDSHLLLIPFEIIHRPDGRYLIEDYTFTYLTAGRDILHFQVPREQGKKSLIIGDPDFDFAAKREGTRDTMQEEKGEAVGVSRSVEMKNLRLHRLPGTKEEAHSIYRLLGRESSELYTGSEAIEEILKSHNDPKFLHVATHGFFLSDVVATAQRVETERDMIVVGKMQGNMVNTMKAEGVENPYIRSGIALAGFNESVKSGGYDGIVTAEKILGLRLRGTEMVVLSACNTGMGDVKKSEGIFGLRRAFIQAGAQGLVMSMWSVPDRESKELMVEFYRSVLEGNLNRSQSLRQAALKQMDIVRRRYGHNNPWYWGAFVYSGRP